MCDMVPQEGELLLWRLFSACPKVLYYNFEFIIQWHFVLFFSFFNAIKHPQDKLIPVITYIVRNISSPSFLFHFFMALKWLTQRNVACHVTQKLVSATLDPFLWKKIYWLLQSTDTGDSMLNKYLFIENLTISTAVHFPMFITIAFVLNQVKLLQVWITFLLL